MEKAKEVPAAPVPPVAQPRSLRHPDAEGPGRNAEGPGEAGGPSDIPTPPQRHSPAEDKDNPFGSNNPGGLRLWTDATGQYRVQARFVSLQDGVARLQKADGRYVRVVVARLSAADRQFAYHQAAAIATDW